MEGFCFHVSGTAYHYYLLYHVQSSLLQLVGEFKAIAFSFKTLHLWNFLLSGLTLVLSYNGLTQS